MSASVKKTVGGQQEIDPQRFVRLVGKKPLRGHAKYKTAYESELFAETFGPPEVNKRKRSSVLYWNFLDYKDGKTTFSMFAEFPDGQKSKNVMVHLVAKKGVISAINWTSDRLNAVENGDEPMLFLDAARFVLTRVC